MDAVFKCFARLVGERLNASGTFSEDTLRYYFYAALLDTRTASVHQIHLERPHPTIDGARMDTWIEFKDLDPVAFEFKLHKKLTSGRNRPRTAMAGALFKDFFRLKKCGSANGYLVYLTDTEMWNYLENDKNGLTDLLHCSELRPLDWSVSRSALLRNTFRKSGGDDFVGQLSICFRKEYPTGHLLAVWSVS